MTQKTPRPVSENKVLEVDVGLVENGDLPRRQPSAQGDHAAAVVVGTFFNHRERRQESLQVQAQVKFGRRLAPAVLSPVHAVGDQGDGGRVDTVNGLLEPARQPLVSTRRAEARELVLQMIEHLPEQRLHHVGVALPVRIGESVATRRGRPAHGEKLRAVVAQGITQIVQPDAMGKLAIQQADHVAPRSKRTTLFIHPILGGQAANHPHRDELAKLI